MQNPISVLASISVQSRSKAPLLAFFQLTYRSYTVSEGSLGFIGKVIRYDQTPNHSHQLAERRLRQNEGFVNAAMCPAGMCPLSSKELVEFEKQLLLFVLKASTARRSVHRVVRGDPPFTLSVITEFLVLMIVIGWIE